MGIFGACSRCHCSPARAPLLPRSRTPGPAVCTPLLLPPRGFVRARPMLPRSGPHSVHAHGGLICGEHCWNELLHCCPMPTHRHMRNLCSRPVRPQVLDAAGLVASCDLTPHCLCPEGIGEMPSHLCPARESLPGQVVCELRHQTSRPDLVPCHALRLAPYPNRFLA